MERRERKGIDAVAVDDQSAKLLGRGMPLTAIDAGAPNKLLILK